MIQKEMDVRSFSDVSRQRNYILAQIHQAVWNIKLSPRFLRSTREVGRATICGVETTIIRKVVGKTEHNTQEGRRQADVRTMLRDN